MKQLDDSKSHSGFTFVTVAPKSSGNDNCTMRRLQALQEVEKAKYRGATITHTGKPGNGLNTARSTSADLESYEMKCRRLLEEMNSGDDFRPILLTFSAVAENQLVHEGPPNNIYNKGNFLKHKDLLYRVFKADARLVRSVLEHSGFTYTDSHDWNMMWLGTSAQQYLYEGLNEYQKINHFPNSFEVTRKDKMAINIMFMQDKFGKEAFDFVPPAFVLPDEFADFYASFHEDKRGKWIVKPSCSSQGRGIHIVDSISEVPMNESCVISKYIQNPLLINGLKFDLRIYVLVTGFDPLKIYLYDEGLARFASEPYNPDTKKNKFSHLTNYSINKKNEKFIQNQDARQDDIGHKWSVSALFRYLEGAGVDTDYLWNRIFDLVVKTILSIEPIVVESVRRLSLHRNNCFDLFGFDVLIDSNLKPWLLEVNLSPSMATDSPLDLHIKSNLIADTFNLLGIRFFDRKRENVKKVKARIRARQNQLHHGNNKPMGLLSIKPAQRREKDVASAAKLREILRESFEEAERRGNFLRIYPSFGTDYYDQFFPTLRSLNKALYKALITEVYFNDISPAPPPVAPPSPLRPYTQIKPTRKAPDQENTTKACSQCARALYEGFPCANCTTEPAASDGKLVITGDDILMEYISRLMHALKAMKEESLKPVWKRSIEKFIEHYVWHAPDSLSSNLWERLDNRIQEMKDRQRRLFGSMKRKHNVKRLEDQKQIVIRGFSASQLEGMLCTSTKNIAQEVVSCLISAEGRGVLTEIIKWLAASAANSSKPELNDESSQKKLVLTKRPYTSGKY